MITGDSVADRHQPGASSGDAGAGVLSWGRVSRPQVVASQSTAPAVVANR
jgi:hypothetical protein